ncbi:hypothetical protein BCY88_29425 [Paraburkholderia fungorum]|uniref:Uncharacterized protein n=1 Tax=Paraburkholderia fungorum TaxID=134537 RepID=A0A3R7I8Y3_9BURK|nr:hypothetical protein BCY88_29425 [Paraburkholderia fungorum]
MRDKQVSEFGLLIRRVLFLGVIQRIGSIVRTNRLSALTAVSNEREGVIPLPAASVSCKRQEQGQRSDYCLMPSA